VEIVRDGDTGIVGISYTSNDGGAVLFARARGGIQAPTAVLAGDSLAFFGGTGYKPSGFGDINGFALAAAENWTNTAAGTAVGFITTPLGTLTPTLQAAILPNGNLGLGTAADANGILTATDKLQVFGDIRVGTTGTNGCLKNFAGTGLAGTCVSDRRYKQNITPFRPVLSQLTALQPVHYYWRAAEFPEKHFGDAQAYGLIAQDVEQVLPELVVTNADGYKAVDYSKLPLLTIQALKELKAENDALKTSSLRSVEELKERVAELERLLTRLLATTSPH
jgi:hypothetical protein